jgi:hypothetical protein
MANSDVVGRLEQLGTAIDGIRSWFSKAWRIGMLMTKGAYLLSERRRLFGKLGEEVYYRMMKGEWQNAELEPLVKQLERLTKKVEIEEMLIRSVRFGTRARGAGVESSAGNED